MPPDPLVATHAYARYYHPATILFPPQLKILYETLHTCIEHASSVPDLTLYTCNRMPPSKKRSGEQSQISWTSSPKVVMTNEIARSVIIT